MADLITLNNISKTFTEDGSSDFLALKDINLSIRQGEFFVFVGPSGCGKSTLLRIMSGLESSYQGTMSFEDITKGNIGFVFQQFALLPWLTVAENIELNLLGSDLNKKARREKVLDQLHLMGLEQFADAKPKNLSGGMRQRVGIARALIRDPKIIFMDEPFSELDSFTAEELRNEVLEIWQRRNLTIVMVTHIIEDAVEMADRIAILKAHPGRMNKIIENNLPRPRHKRSEEFYKIEDELYALMKYEDKH
jgi:NitT/TauT family transport system ATP-binding protein